MGKRGSVLLHVLMTGALIALVSATLLRLALMRYTVTARATNTTRERRYDEAAVAMLTSKWNSNNVYCQNASDGNVTYNCSGGGPGYAPPLVSCSCTCTNPAGTASVYPKSIIASGSPPACRLDVLSQDLP